MLYDINRPWLSLDPWQKDYIFNTPPGKSCFLLCGRQVGKTTAMSIKAVELCVKAFKKGEFVLINSITEKQAYHMLAKASVYANQVYPNQIITKGSDKPTKHRLMFKNGTGILCYAAGETGQGLRGLTIKKLMSDEGSRMSEEYFIATSPMLSVIGGSEDIASTPAGKLHKNGDKKYFYKASLDKKYERFYVSAEDCPRHSKEFLKEQESSMSKLAYAQEYRAVFTDELRRLYDNLIIEKCCVLNRPVGLNSKSKYYLGVDVGGLGDDETTLEVFERRSNGALVQVENIVEKRNYTTDTTKRIIALDEQYNFKQIGVDDQGIGFGVLSELLVCDQTKRKVVPLNNSSRDIDYEGKKSTKILKEEMYINLQVLMEQGKVQMLMDRDVQASLASIQHEQEKIFGGYSHITEGIIRAVWLAEKDKSLNIYIY